MIQIARWTTPTVSYKPKAVPIDTIKEIFLSVKQSGATVIEKGIDDATIDDEHGFTWTLTQQETGMLDDDGSGTLQCDFLCYDGERYTTRKKQFTAINSAIDEVI